MEYTQNTQPKQKYREYVCKLKSERKITDYSSYKFYDKSRMFSALKFLHRAVASVFLRAYLKCAYKVKVVGKQNARKIKKSGGVVISNHIHPLDIQMVNVFLFGIREVNWLTLQRNMDLSVRFLIRTSGGIPIPENPKQKKRCFKEMNELLSNGGILYVCPEGSLVELCKDIRPFKDGAFRFAYQNKVPLLPVTLRFTTHSVSGKKYRCPHFVIDVSQPVYPVYPQNVIKEKAQRAMLARCAKNAIADY